MHTSHHRRPAASAVITPTVTRWPHAARAAGWTLLVLTLNASWVFGIG